MYFPNDDTQDYPFCRFKLVVEMFKHTTNQKINKSPQSCWANEQNSVNSKTLESSGIKSPLPPPSLCIICTFRIEWNAQS